MAIRISCPVTIGMRKPAPERVNLAAGGTEEDSTPRSMPTDEECCFVCLEGATDGGSPGRHCGCSLRAHRACLEKMANATQRTRCPACDAPLPLYVVHARRGGWRLDFCVFAVGGLLVYGCAINAVVHGVLNVEHRMWTLFVGSAFAALATLSCSMAARSPARAPSTHLYALKPETFGPRRPKPPHPT